MNQQDKDKMAKLGLALEVVVVGFRALEFMGKHTHSVTNGDGMCKQCEQAHLHSAVGMITVDQAADNLCNDLKQAINQYKTGLMVVEQWERTGEDSFN